MRKNRLGKKISSDSCLYFCKHLSLRKYWKKLNYISQEELTSATLADPTTVHGINEGKLKSRPFYFLLNCLFD